MFVSPAGFTYRTTEYNALTLKGVTTISEVYNPLTGEWVESSAAFHAPSFEEAERVLNVVTLATSLTLPNTHCYCESSMCDHDGPCNRTRDERLVMAYVTNTCTQCASNMCATGGSEYITLAECKS